MGIRNIAQLINDQKKIVIEPDEDDGETIVRGED
jgi:hypothetical protein